MSRKIKQNWSNWRKKRINRWAWAELFEIIYIIKLRKFFTSVMAQINNMTRRIINNDDDVFDSNRNPMARKIENSFFHFLNR